MLVEAFEEICIDRAKALTVTKHETSLASPSNGSTICCPIAKGIVTGSVVRTSARPPGVWRAGAARVAFEPGAGSGGRRSPPGRRS